MVSALMAEGSLPSKGGKGLSRKGKDACWKEGRENLNSYFIREENERIGNYFVSSRVKGANEPSESE